MRAFTSFAVLALLASSAFAGPRYAVGVDGLACPFCAYGLEKRLSREPGVAEIETDIAASRIVVEMQDDASLAEPQARQAVEDAGFTLRSFEVLSE